MASPLFLLLKTPCGVTPSPIVTPQESKKEGGEQKINTRPPVTRAILPSKEKSDIPTN
jgi:hypothetical protein